MMEELELQRVKKRLTWFKVRWWAFIIFYIIIYLCMISQANQGLMGYEKAFSVFWMGLFVLILLFMIKGIRYNLYLKPDIQAAEEALFNSKVESAQQAKKSTAAPKPRPVRPIKAKD